MTTDITELEQSLKAAAEKATPGEWVYFPKNTSIEYDVGSDESQGSILYVDSGDFTQAQTDRNGEFIALANPANILALVEALDKAQAINAAAEKLVRCKGRYHSEQNYRALAALFGVNTPDLQPLDGESRTVTVKLPSIYDELFWGYGAHFDPQEYERGLVEVLTAAGIKVEDE